MTRFIGSICRSGVVAAVALAGLAGCQHNNPGDAAGPARNDAEPLQRLTWYESWDAYDGMARPAPAPAPRAAEKPREQPKPAARTEPRRTEAPRTGGRTVMYLPTGDRATSALMVERFFPSEVTAGQPFEYEIRVTNLTSNELNGVTVTDTVPEGLTISKSDPASEGRAPNLGWNLGNMDANEVRSIRVTAVATGTGTFTNCVTAMYNNALCQQIAATQPALRIVKTAPADALVCDNIPIRIEVTNSGTGAARNVRVRDALPEGMSVDGRRELELDGGTLASGQTRTFNLTARAERAGSYQNKATAVAEGNLSAESNVTTTAVRQPVLTITAACPESVFVGRSANLCFEVRNTSETPASATVVTANVPQGGQFVSADGGGAVSGNTIRWNVGTLGAGESRRFCMNVRAMGMGASIQASASVTATCATAVNANCAVPVQGVADIGTTVTDTDGVVMVGEDHQYQCEVKNQGQINLTNTKMIVTLPEGLQFVSAQAANQPRVNGNKVEFNLGTVPAGQTVRFTLTTRATTPGEHLVIGETTATELRTPVRDDELTNFVAGEENPPVRRDAAPRPASPRDPAAPRDPEAPLEPAPRDTAPREPAPR